MAQLSDLDVYARLNAIAEELEALSRQSGSLVGETALKTAALSVRGMASAVYEHSLGGDAGGQDS